MIEEITIPAPFAGGSTVVWQAFLNDPKAGTPTTWECWSGMALEQLPTQVVPAPFVQVTPARMPEDQLLDAMEEAIGIRSREKLRIG